MNPTTLAIRDMYEQFPYPAVPELEIRIGSNVRYLLSCGRLDRSAKKPLQCLDAGCGRGNQVLGAAFSQPEVQFTGIDVNRVTLNDAAAEAKKQGLKNVRFQEVDLMTLAGLEVPEGGFDVIFSSGVLHHLASPEEGLRQLRRVLAPHGIISLMVYGTRGRESLYRIVRAVDLLVPRDRPVAERLAVAKQFAQEMGTEVIRSGPCGLQDGLHDNEFVDRYLNVNEVSYEVAELWALLERNGLKFLRWFEPGEWAPPDRTPASRTLTARLTDLQRFQLVELTQMRHKLELLICAADNGPRPLPPAEAWPETFFALNPEVTIETATRNLHRSQRVERLSYQLRLNKPVELGGLTASVLLVTKDRNTPFQGRRMLDALVNGGQPRERFTEVVGDLLAREILYCPQASLL